MELTPVRRNFPSTVTVLAVDSDIEHLLNLTRLLRSFEYQVVTCQTATGALSLLRKRTNEFQILLADVALPDIDGFDLLTVATSEFPTLQVVLFSDAGYETSAVRALELGACAFYTKPIPSDVVEHVWQHVFSRKVEPLPPPPPLPIVSPTGPAPKRKREDGDLNSSAIIQGKEGKRLKSVKNAAAGSRKPRVWSPELHSKFLAAVKLIGADNLTSGKILKAMEQMGVVGLREPQVSSHLQQHRRKTLPHSEAELSEPSSYKETSSPQNQTTPSSAAATESHLSDQLHDITSTDYTTFQQSSQETSSYGGGGVVESGGEDFDWCFNLDSSFLENELGSISNLLACC